MDTIISEIFQTHQVRKTKKQKTAFIDYTLNKAKLLGWNAEVEKGAFGVRNIVVGDPDHAKIIYTAHYDTCARLPFPNFLTPQNIGIYLLYQAAVILGFFLIAFAVGLGMGLLCAWTELPPSIASLTGENICFALLLLLIFGPANKHTANDNTSGVTVLFGIMRSLPADQRDAVALVFFDHEESGLLGSASFARKHKQVKRQTLLINYDCVSDGRDMMIYAPKKASIYRKALADAFAANEHVEAFVTDKAFYPSDQAKFLYGVGVAAFRKTKGGMLYMNRIHTKQDTVYRRENIDFLVDASLKLTDRWIAIQPQEAF